MKLEKYYDKLDGRAYLKSPMSRFQHDDIVTDNPEMLRQLQLVERVAASSVPIFIQGEQGVGKEQIVKFAVRRAERAVKWYTLLNCAAIPKERWGTELFGRSGYELIGRNNSILDACNGGTLFLKDVNLMPRDVQIRLVETLKKKEPAQQGTRPRYDIRVIAAYTTQPGRKETCSNLTEEMFYFLNIIKVRVPPLRERPEDVALLASYFLEEITMEYGMRHTFSWEMLSALVSMEWEDNTRQLKNTVERLAWMSESETISDLELLRECVSQPDQDQPVLSIPSERPNFMEEGRGLKEMVGDYEMFIIRMYLERYGSLRKAAKALKVSPASLSRKLSGERKEED